MIFMRFERCLSMCRTFAILLSIFSLSVAAFGARTNQKALLRDGFALMGVDGKLKAGDSNEPGVDISQKWFFELDSDVDDEEGVIKAGTVLELLGSATLEQITSDVNDQRDMSYRLWGTVTRYENRNFIFPNYFLPMRDVEEVQPQEPETLSKTPTINAPNDLLTIPKEIVKLLAARKTVRTVRLKKGLELKYDTIMVDRTGFIVEQTDGGFVFVVDALGQNASKISIRLLPCQVLERARGRQSTELERLRFKVAGILTRYKGQYYLLLQRARRVHSHGNFGR